MKKIKCTYGKTGFISMEKLDNKDVLQIDLNIKEFKILNQVWKDVNFPSNISINDKLYLDEALKDKIISLLDCFIATGYLADPDQTQTERGFSLLELKDLMGNTISIQESSSAEQAKIWFGCETKNKAFLWENNALVPYEFPRGDILMEDRLHLNSSKAKRLKLAIESEWQNHFINKNSLEIKKPKMN